MESFVIILTIAAVLAVIPAGIASRKGRDFGPWWFYGWMLFIVALIHSLLLREDVKSKDAKLVRTGDYVKCPSCAEMVRSEATKCRYCQTILEPVARVNRTAGVLLTDDEPQIS